VSIDGHLPSEAALIAAFEQIEAQRGDISLSYFEYGTLAALLLFREARVDLQVLEVGLGGRLDATNIVDAEAALITSIGLDHQAFLGDTRDLIGFEKAGVMRGGCIAVCADPRPPASLLAYAQVIGAGLWCTPRDFGYEESGALWSWRGRDQPILSLPRPALAGPAQLRNAAGVVAIVQRLQPQLPADTDAIARALLALSLPGRFERRGRLILDVGHNAEAADTIAENLRILAPGRRVHLVLGMLDDKPVTEYCRRLAPQVAAGYFSSLPPPRGLSAEALKTLAAAGGIAGTCYDTPRQALAAAQARAGADELIIACGSFLTVAAIMDIPA